MEVHPLESRMILKFFSGLFGHGLSLFVVEVVDLVEFGGFEFKFLNGFFQVVHGLALWLLGLV